MKNWKKGVFLAIVTNLGKDMTDKLRKNAYSECIFIPEKYVFRVSFENPFRRMITSPKYKCPPPPVDHPGKFKHIFGRHVRPRLK